MPIRVALWLVVMTLVASASAQGTDWTVYLRRVGPIHVGMSLRQVRAVLGDRAALLGGRALAVPLDCAYLQSAKLPEQVKLMFEHGRVVRIDISAPGVQTASGIQVGATEDDVKHTYNAKIQIQPHKYDPGGHYLRYVAVDVPDRPFGLVFETDGQHVTSFRVGTVDAVSLVEGCA